MDAFSDGGVEKVVFVKATQIGGMKCVIGGMKCVIGGVDYMAPVRKALGKG